MKKLIPILLVLLLLSGCGKNPAQPAAQLPQATEIQDTEVLVSLYDADSEAETQTDGAVRVYPLGDELYTGLLPCGKKLLVVSGGGELTLLQGERGEIAATTATQMSSAWASTDLCAGAQGIAYYSSDTMEVVMMDEQMQVTARIPMPEAFLDLTGYLGSLCTPISIIITGSNLARRSLKKMLTSPLVYYTAAIRLIAIPLVITVLLWLVGIPDDFVVFGCVLAAMPTAAVVTMYAEMYDIKPGVAAEFVGSTSILCTATLVPVISFAAWLVSLR